MKVSMTPFQRQWASRTVEFMRKRMTKEGIDKQEEVFWKVLQRKVRGRGLFADLKTGEVFMLKMLAKDTINSARTTLLDKEQADKHAFMEQVEKEIVAFARYLGKVTNAHFNPDTGEYGEERQSEKSGNSE